MITIYETKEQYRNVDNRLVWGRMSNALKPDGKVTRTVEIAGPVEAADMGFGVWGGRVAGLDGGVGGVQSPSAVVEMAERGEHGLSIVAIKVGGGTD